MEKKIQKRKLKEDNMKTIELKCFWVKIGTIAPKCFRKKKPPLGNLTYFWLLWGKKKEKYFQESFAGFICTIFFCFHKENRCANSDLGENISDLIQIISDQREPSLVSNAGIMMRNRKFYNFYNFHGVEV